MYWPETVHLIYGFVSLQKVSSIEADIGNYFWCQVGFVQTALYLQQTNNKASILTYLSYNINSADSKKVK